MSELFEYASRRRPLQEPGGESGGSGVEDGPGSLPERLSLRLRREARPEAREGLHGRGSFVWGDARGGMGDGGGQGLEIGLILWGGCSGAGDEERQQHQDRSAS